MKKVLRSLAHNVTDTAQIVENYKVVAKERLLALSTTEDTYLTECVEFYIRTQQPPSLSYLEDLFATGNKPEELSLLEEVMKTAPEYGSSFEQLFEREVEEQAIKALADTCREGLKIATQGVSNKGMMTRGTDAAVAFLFSALKGKPARVGDKLPASMQLASSKLSDIYTNRKNNPNTSYGIMTGYGLIDASTAGIRKKQFYIHAGSQGHLKSTHAMNMTLNAVVDGGWNVMFFSSEMPAVDIMLMMTAMHSAHPKFHDYSKPVSAFKLLLGKLDSKEEATFQTVKDDLVNNPAHGTIKVVDSGDFTSLGTIKQRVVREHMEDEVDMVWIDYITRLPIDPIYARMDVTTAMNKTLEDAKRWAMSFDQGKGLAVCTPFQINREGFKKAKDNGGKLEKTALAQYNAAEKEADVITYIWFDEDEELTNEPKCGMMKSRWGKRMSGVVNLYIEADSRRIVDLSAGMGLRPTGSPTAGVGAVDVEL